MKTLWIVANWKSNKTIAEALDWVGQVGPKLIHKPGIQVVVCPTFLAAEEVKKVVMVGHFPLLVGVQDLSPFEEGPFTGEEAARILSDVVDLAILGHSERRQNFGETDQMVAQKVAQALKYNIKPLVCVQGPDTPVPPGVKLVAYEPLFAIGTGHPEDPVNASQVARQLKERVDTSLQVLYGGSVTGENVGSFLSVENLSGLLVGGASLDPQQFGRIVQSAYETN